MSLKSSFVMSEYYNLELIKIGTKSFDSLESFSLSNNPKLKKLEINNYNVEDNYDNTLYTFSNINNISNLNISSLPELKFLTVEFGSFSETISVTLSSILYLLF